MASLQAKKRLQKEYANLAKGPPPYCFARPNESNLLECHFIIRGPEDSPYAGGEYHGVLEFPTQYPFAPGIKMLTPSGRFQPNTKICTSMSDFHPGSWNPAWSIETILTGLLSFMLSDEITTGSIRTTEDDKKRLAAISHSHNLKDPKFTKIFSEYAEAMARPLPNMGEKERGGAGASSVAAPGPAPAKSASASAGLNAAAQVGPDRPPAAHNLIHAIDERHRDGGGSTRTIVMVAALAILVGLGSRLL